MLATMVVRSLLNNARISAWTLLTLATCAALVTLFTTATFEVGRKMSTALRLVGANAVAYPAAAMQADWSAFTNIVRVHGANAAQLAVRVGMVQGNPVAVVASEPKALRELTPYWAVTGRRAVTAQECVAGRRAATTLGLKPGQPVSIKWPDQAQSSQFIVTGVMETGDEDDDRLFVTGPLERTEFCYALLSVPGGEEEIGRVTQALVAASANIEIKPLRQILRGEQHVLEKVNLLCVVSLWTVLVLTALGVSASMLARVVERRKEFALLQALGAKRRSVVGFLLAESATLGLIAAIVGFGVGTALAALVSRQVFQATIAPHGTAAMAALGTTTLVALLAGGIACACALRFQPATALRGE
jgi:putative ABC transport system permease protein